MNYGNLWDTSDSCAPTLLKQNKATASKSEDKRSGKEAGKGDTSESSKTAVVFSLKNEVGGLVRALRLFQVNADHASSAASR